MILLIIFAVIIQIMEGSLTLDAFLVDSSTSLVVHIFNMVSIGIIVRQVAAQYGLTVSAVIALRSQGVEKKHEQ